MVAHSASHADSEVSSQPRSWLLLTLICLVGLSVSLLGYAATKSIVEREAWEAFHETSIERIEGIEAAIRMQIASLAAARGLFAASQSVDRDEFSLFAQIAGLGAGVIAMNWVPRVDADGRARFEAAARADGIGDFAIREVDDNGQLVIAGPRSEYFPVFYIEPLEPNRGVLGFDLASNPERLAAIESARDAGTAVASQPIELVQSQGDKLGFLVFLPLYRGGTVPEELAARRSDLIGFALAVYRTSDLIEEVLSSHSSAWLDVAIHVYDETDPEQTRLIHSNQRLRGSARADMRPSRDGVSRTFDVAGRRWRIDMVSPPGWRAASAWQPWLALGVGLGLTLVVLFCVRLILDRGRFADQLAQQRTAELSQITARLRAEIRERGEIEQAMCASEARLRGSIDSLSDGFAIFDKQDRLVMWNKPYQEFHYRIRKYLKPGVTYQELAVAGAKTGQWRDSVYALKGDQVDPRKLPERERQLSDGRWLLIRSHETGDGELVDIRTDISEFKLQNEELRYHRDGLEEIVAQRTRELKTQAEQLRDALEKEKEYNVLQQQFISMVSHEFRTPLAIIDSTAQRILSRRDRITPDEIGQRVGKVRSSVKRLVLLIEDTLSLSRIQAGKIELRRELGDLRGAIAEVCEQHRPLSGAHTFECALGELPISLPFDQRLMGQVFSNLLVNAVKYSPQGGLVRIEAGTGGEAAFVSIRDHGMGIPKEDMPKLFTRFYRASNVSGIAGTGIGLNLCRHIVELHGGTLTVESIEGEGSTFTARLPLVVPDRGELQPNGDCDGVDRTSAE